MKYINKILNSQPTISFATFRDMKIVISNKGFNNFFEIKEKEIDLKLVDIRDILSIVNNDWIEKMLSEPQQPYHLKFYKQGIEYYFNIYLAINHIDEQCLYVYTMLDVSELERLKERELNQAKMVSIGELSLGLTHEINTPLTYIKGNIELMEMDISEIKNDSLEKMFHQNISSIKDGSLRIQTIIELLQEYQSSVEHTGETININETIYNSFQLTYNRSKYISQIYFNNQVMSVNMNSINQHIFHIKTIQKIKLEQVLVILISNSLDELTSSEIDFDNRFIKIDVENLDNNKVLISVKDNGGGIDENIKDKIFDAFISGKTQSGLGLGLNIAEKIIKDSFGTISAYNIENGALFKLIL